MSLVGPQLQHAPNGGPVVVVPVVLVVLDVLVVVLGHSVVVGWPVVVVSELSQTSQFTADGPLCHTLFSVSVSL